METKFNFINQTTGAPNANVVIFQKNVALGSDGSAIAWRVLKNTAGGWQTEFVVPTDCKVAASDSDGKETSHLAAKKGDKFIIKKEHDKEVIKLHGKAFDPQSIEIENGLSSEQINAKVYKEGKLLAELNHGAPGQTAVFKFEPSIWIGVFGDVPQGGIIKPARMDYFPTEISLLGIKSADIIMENPKGTTDDRQFTFNLENIVPVPKK